MEPSGLGHRPHDAGAERHAYDVGLASDDGRMRFIVGKARAAGAATVTIRRYELMTALNQPEQRILALVESDDGHPRPSQYVRCPFRRASDVGVTSVSHKLGERLERAEVPA